MKVLACERRFAINFRFAAALRVFNVDIEERNRVVLLKSKRKRGM